MTRDTLQIPTARTWRDIPQPVVPRAMSREGRWRLTMASLRWVALGAVALALAAGVRMVVVSLDENVRAMPTAAKATPMKVPQLRTDGVLDDAWLVRTLAIPKNTSLMELDLLKLRARLLTDPQVVNATLTRNFPDELVVQVTERSPVARVMTEWLGQQKAFLVSREGVIYAGTGYDAALLQTLPWLDGVTIVPRGGDFQPIEGMETASELLAKARLEAEHLYATWSVVSLARLTKDHQLEVRTKNGVRILFSTRDDYFRQLAKLNYVWDQLANVPAAGASIDLSLGRDVPVMVDGAAEAAPDRAHAREAKSVDRPMRAFESPFARPAPAESQQALFVLPHSQSSRSKREL